MQFSKNSGLLQNEQNSAKLRWRTKTKVFIPKYTQILMISWVQPHKQTIFIAKSTKKQFLLTNSHLINSILGVSGLELHSSRTEPVNFFEAQSSLREAQFSFWDAQAVIWGGGAALEFPLVAPGLGGAKPFKFGWAVFLIPMQKYHHYEQQSFNISLWLYTHNHSVYYNLLKANLGTAVPYRSWHTVIMCSFKCLYHQLVFQKK